MKMSMFLIMLFPVAVLSAHAFPLTKPPEDRDDIYRNGTTESGVYYIYPPESDELIEVYCDMNCHDREEDIQGGGWTMSVFLITLLPVAVLSAPAFPLMKPPEDCDDIYRNGTTESGVYTIYPPESDEGFKVYCEMDCHDRKEDSQGGGWTVFQSRMDGTVNFYRPWIHYKDGFGDLNGEHWLGLEKLFRITWKKKYTMMVEMEDFEGGSVYSSYKNFIISPESDYYRLHLGEYTDGGAGYDLKYSDGMQFSTFDMDMDGSYYQNLAENHAGGFWHGYRVQVNPNGIYKWGRHSESRSGVLWSSWKGPYYSLKFIRMKIRPLSLEEAEGNQSDLIHGGGHGF